MSSIAKLANGTLFQLGAGSGPVVYTTVPEIMKLKGPSVKTAYLDVTTHDDSSLFQEWVPGLSDTDNIRFSCNLRLSNTIHQSLITHNINGDQSPYQIVFPDTGSFNTVNFTAFMADFAGDFDIGEVMKVTAGQLKINGAPLYS